MSRAVNPALAAKLEAERRLKEGISGHRTGLPKKLLDLFQPLDPPIQLTPLPKTKLKLPYLGIAQYVGEFAEPTDPEYEPNPSDGRPRLFANPELQIQARVDKDSIYERRLRAAKEKGELADDQIKEGLREWDPAKDPSATADPFKTLFVARISFEATERKLKREFEEYGPIKSIRLVHEKNNGKSRGYAFIEFEHKQDMKTAYKLADGKKIEGKRVIVDVERGRTVPNWRSRRFGGGKGGESRETKVSKKKPAIPKLPEAAAPAEVPAAPRSAADEDKEKERERERDRERERARAKDRDRERDRDRDRERDRAKEQDLSRVPPPGQTSARSEKDRDVNGKVDAGRDRERDPDRRDRDRDRDRDRKRDRPERENGERDRREDSHRSSKRHKDERERPRRRERDLL